MELVPIVSAASAVTNTVQSATHTTGKTIREGIEEREEELKDLEQL